jgi:hypothetical protein
MALVKYEHNRDLVPVNRPEPEVIKKPSRVKHHLAKFNTPLSDKTFIMSHLSLLLLSLAFLAGLYFVLNKDINYTQSLISDYNTPVTMKPASFTLDIKNPEDESLIATKSLVISGKTGPKSSVVVAVDGISSTYTGVEADSNGDFQLTVSLANGLNMLEIMAFDQQGNSKSLKRSVYYTEEQL